MKGVALMRMLSGLAIAATVVFATGCSAEESTKLQCEGDTWSEEIFATTPPDFAILTPREDETAADIKMVIEVFGVRLMAVEGVTERDLVLSANVLAQWIDNDEDGRPDNTMVQSELQRQNGRMIVHANFDELGPWHDEKQRFLDDEHAPTYGLDVTTINHSRYGLEPSSYSDDWVVNDPTSAPDAASEETFHLMTDVGFAGVYPADFWPAFEEGASDFHSQVYQCFVAQQEGKGLEGASRLTAAMDTARGGFFADIPEQYPSEAWYTRYDECEYPCLAGEYLHWAGITRAGMMEGRVTGMARNRNGEGDEWSLETAEELRRSDPAISELLDRADINFPSVAPDGTYRN